jgi:hypothetical protein
MSAPRDTDLSAVREELRLRIEAWRNTRVGRILPHATTRILEPLDAYLAAPRETAAASALDVEALRVAINRHSHTSTGGLQFRVDHVHVERSCAESIAAEYERLRAVSFRA